MYDVKGEFVRWRKAHGYTQEEAAEMLGIPRATLSNFEIGRHYLKGEHVLMILDLLMPGWDSTDNVRLSASCPKCHNRVPGVDQGATNCFRCGYELGSTCPECHAPNMSGAKFCSECGSGLTKKAI